ncbi:hypothetical protein [Limosilactobacillus secaliphilus]|nr:hypothetical protein [Limosilactobacillus secaliphilus]
MAYCHYVSLFISIELCAAILVIYWIQERKITLLPIINILKAIGLFLVLSLWQFIPLMTDYFHKGLVRPTSGFTLIESAGDFVVSAINNDALNRGGIGLLLLISIMVGWKQINRNSVYMWIYTLGVLLTWMITTAFPWKYLVKTPLSIIQFPYRYTSFAAFFLAIVLSKLLFNVHFDKIPLFTKSVLIGIILLTLYGGSIYNDYFRNKGDLPDISRLTHAQRGSYRTLRDAKDTPLLIDNRHYNDQFSYGALYGETDYMPMNAFNKSKSVLNRVVLVDNKRSSSKVNMKTSPNSITYRIYLNKGSMVDLPVLAYKHTLVRINHHTIKTRVSDRGTVCSHLNAGQNTISVTYKTSHILVIARIVSLLSWISLIFLKLRKMR